MSRTGGIAIVLLSCATIAGCDRLSGGERAPAKVAQMPPPVVLVSTPVVREVTDFEDFTGRTDAMFSVEVRARVSGYLEKVNFEDGTEVKEGDVLFQIDPRQYQAELDRTEASIVQAEAHMRRLEANHRRAMNLFSRGAISREEVDNIVGDYEEAKAAVGIAKAQRDLAKLNLGFTKVTAPISGRASRRLVDPGNLVQADVTPLTTIVSLDPIYVYFDIDERTLLNIRKLIQQGKIQSREAGAVVPVLTGVADEEGFPHQGTVNFSDNRVDPNTGTLRVRGVLPNPKPRLLSPGMFMRVRVPIGHPHQSILIPERALGTDQGRKFVYLVNDQNEVVYRRVEIGSFNEGMRVIDEGLEQGDRVVVSGMQRIRPGIKVEPRPAEEESMHASASRAPSAATPEGRKPAVSTQPPRG